MRRKWLQVIEVMIVAAYTGCFAFVLIFFSNDCKPLSENTEHALVQVCLLFCLSVCLFICLFCLSACLSACLSVYLSACLSVCLFVCLSACLFVWQPVCVSVCLFVYSLWWYYFIFCFSIFNLHSFHQFFCIDGKYSSSARLFFDPPESIVKNLLHGPPGMDRLDVLF